MSVKDRIIQKRMELGLNQTELAKRAGLKPPAISQYESGARNPSYDALIKLASALNVNIDYLVSGIENKDNQILDPRSEVLLKMIQSLSPLKREEIIEYALLSSGQKKLVDFWSTDPKQYARYIFENFFEKKLPVDIFKLADYFKVKIIKGELNGEAEAILLKGSSTIILDQSLTHEARIKFAIATLIGHLIMPWHTESSYSHRKSGSSTLSTESTEEMEAGSFAANLITPPEELENDLSKYKSSHANLEELEELAKKYKVSLNALCNRLIELHKKRFATITSGEYKITKSYSIDIALRDKGSNLDKRSKAFELLENRSEKIEFKAGKVPASAWIVDAKENELVYESSVFNPTYNSVFTLITK